MPLTVQHVKTSLIADDADTSLVRPSDWNSSHAVTFSPDATEVIKVISAGAQSVSSGSVVFANSNGVTFGMNAGTITASVPAVGGAQTGISGLSAGTTLATSGTVSFGNSNGISFGMNGNTLTASYTVPSVPAQTAFVLSNSNNVSFGTNGSTVTATATFNQTVQTQNMVSILGSTGNISFQNGNGVSFGGNASTVTASVAAQTVQPVAASGSNGSFAFSTVSFGNSNGLSFYTTNGSMVGSYTVPSVPAQTNQTLGLYAVSNTTGQSSSSTVDARSLSFQGAGVASVGYSNGSVVVSVPAGGGGGDGYNQAGFTNSTANSTMSLVWAGNSNGSGNVTMGLTGSTITASAPAGAGGGIAAAAGTQTATSGTINFANSNGISFGMSNSSQITASYTVPNTVGLLSAINVSAGTTSNNLSAVTLSNSNNVSFGLNGSVVTATATFAQTVQPAVAQLNGSSGTMSFAVGSSLSASSNASTITFGLASNWSTTIMPLGNSTGYASSVLSGTFLTTAALSNHSHNLATTTTNGSLVVIATTNSAGATMAVPPFITTYAAQTQDPINLYATGNTTQSSQGTGNVSALSFRGEGIASVGVSGNSVVISVPSGGGAGDGVNVIQLGTTNTTGTSWSSISATVGLNGSGGIVISQNNSNQLVVSYSGTGDVEGMSLIGNVVGNSTVAPNANTIYLSGGPNITLSGTGNTINISGDTPEAYQKITLFPLHVNPFALSGGAVLNFGTSLSTASMGLIPLYVEDAVTFDELYLPIRYANVSVSSAASQTAGVQWGIYSRNASTFSLISSSSYSIGVTGSAASYTVNFPATTSTSGYSYTTTALTATAQFGTFLSGYPTGRLVFGNTVSLSSGQYYVGLLGTLSTSSTRNGLNIVVVDGQYQAQMQLSPRGFRTYTSIKASEVLYTKAFEEAANVSWWMNTVGTASLPDSIAVANFTRTSGAPFGMLLRTN